MSEAPESGLFAKVDEAVWAVMAKRDIGCAITGKKFSELAELLPSMRVTGG